MKRTRAILTFMVLAHLIAWTSTLAAQRTDAVLLVNSASPSYADAQHFIRPYLDQFGVPYTVLDIATTAVTSSIGNYALIIVGHKNLDVGTNFLSNSEQSIISQAVQNGTGLVNFESALSPNGNTPQYKFVQDIFGFSYIARQTSQNVLLSNNAPTNYITAKFVGGQVINTTTLTSAGVQTPLPANVQNLARIAILAQPILMTTTYGSGRAVQWASYEWASYAIKGPTHEFDGLVWRSLVWAARKPFVIQGMPNFVTMRVDDVHGGFWWLDAANAYGYKPWLGLFYKDILEQDAQKIATVVNAGLGTASVHAKGASGGTYGDFFFFDHYGGVPFPDAVVNANFDDATAWHTQHGIPISKYALSHWYEMGSNVFTRLQQWGVQFVGIHQAPDQVYVGASWLQLAPYRLFETGAADQFASNQPVYYADYLTVPGHAELDHAFFDCITEIRDDASYEWYPDNDVPGTVGRGTRQLRRALDGMFLSTLFTHEQLVQTITPANWDAELSGISANLQSYAPIYTTLDQACQYMRALKTSSIASSSYDPATRVLTTSLSGSADVSTKFHAFIDTGGQIGPVMVDVPVFSGSTQVVTTLPGTLHHVTVTPAVGEVPPGKTQQFVATGYDIGGAAIPGLAFTWTAGSGGTIDANGLFTAGGSIGTFTNAVSATSGAVTGFATVDVYPPSLAGFDFSTIGGTLYAGSAFPITIRARDQHGRILDTYTGQAGLVDSTGTIQPQVAGPFVSGVWTGNVTIGTVSSGATISVSDGARSGVSNAFALLAPRSGTIVINCWDDANQQPYLPTTTSNIDLNPTDGNWTEFWYQCACRNYPAVFAAAGEAALGLPVMRFTASGIQNATYELRAKLYTDSTGRNMRYFYGFTPSAPTAYFKDTIGGSGGAEGFTEYVLGNVAVTNGTFNLYVQDAQLQSGSDPYFGWAQLRLVQLPGPVDHVTVTPNPGQVPQGGTLQFTAQAYDALGVPIFGIPFTWSASAGGTIDQNGLFTSTSSGFYANAISAQGGGLTGYASVNSYVPVLDHLQIDPIPSPQYAGSTFTLRITARDQSGNVVTTFGGSAQLTDTTGTISPATTGAFTAGVWTGPVSLSQTASGVSISATSGSASASSNAFDVLPPRSGTITINLWEDNHQAPVLATTSDAGQLLPNDGLWTEFFYPQRGYPSVLAAAGESAYGLPVMHFYDAGLAHGQYQVYAKLYTNDPGRNMRYFYGYTPQAPTAFFVDTIGGDGGPTEQHAEYLLGTYNVTDGHFDIYVRDAALLSGTYPFFGWATIRLVQQQCTLQTYYLDADGDGFGTASTSIQACAPPAGYVANADDCNDADAASFGFVTEAAGLTVTKSENGVVVSWAGQAAATGPGTTYDIVDGFGESLEEDQGFQRAGCLANDVPTNAYEDTSATPPTDGRRLTYYLVRAVNSCGDGTFGGSGSRAALDASSPCP